MLKKKYLFGVLAFSMFFIGCQGSNPYATEKKVYESVKELVAETRKKIDEISVEDLKTMLESGEDMTLIDVRDESEFADGAIENAIHLPRGLLEYKIKNHVKDKNAQIVIYCKKGSRGALAARSLMELGYTDVVNLTGGWLGWEEGASPAGEKNASPVEKPFKNAKEMTGVYRTEIDEIEVKTLKEWIENDKEMVLLDVREASEYNVGHIEDAVHISRGTLEFHAAKKLQNKDAMIVIYCKSGSRGVLAVRALESLGYTNVVNLAGGFEGWKTGGGLKSDKGKASTGGCG